MSKILVTGGAGYIGSHTVVELIEQGYEVVIVDDLSNSEASVIDGIEKITGVRPHFELMDLVDRGNVEALFQKHPDIDGVVHFAAKKAVGESVENPLLYYRVNIDSLLNLLEEMALRKVNNIVFSSSCTVYGQPEKLPVTESTPFQPAESPYGYTKQVGEVILKDTCHALTGFQAIALRYFNPVGAHKSALIGELPRGVPSNLIPFITQTAAGLRDKLKVFGADYETPDGSAIRDYIHVIDLAKAHVIALKRQLEKKQKKNFEFFNLGTGRGFSVLEVVKTFQRVNNVNLNYEIVGRRDGDVVQIYADTSYANDELSWQAKLSLEDMLTSSWNWQQSLNR